MISHESYGPSRFNSDLRRLRNGLSDKKMCKRRLYDFLGLDTGARSPEILRSIQAKEFAVSNVMDSLERRSLEMLLGGGQEDSVKSSTTQGI